MRLIARFGIRAAWSLLCGGILSLSVVSQAVAQAPAVVDREYTIKAAYLYNFSHYVTWPDGKFLNDQSPMVIGVLGPDPFGAVLDRIAQRGEKATGRPIAIRRFLDVKDVAGSHILFIGPKVAAPMRAEAVRIAANSSVLLVGEMPGFAEKGAVVNFFVVGNRVRFEMNPRAARQRNLKISAKVLNLARIVGEPQGGAKR